MRKTQYGYDFCVNCSDVGMRKAIPVQKGTGDHTWNEILIVSEEHYEEYITERENSTKKNK